MATKKKAAPKKKRAPAKKKPATDLSIAEPTEQMKLFAKLYVAMKFNGTQAAIEAGYSAKTAAPQASRLLTNPKIQILIQEESERLYNKVEVTADRIIQEASHLAFLDIGEAFNEHGRLKNIQDMPPHVRRALAAIEVETIFPDAEDDEDSEPTSVAKIKFTDKRSSLELLAKLIGLLGQKIEVSGPDGGPIEVTEPRDIARRIAFLLMQGSKK